MKSSISREYFIKLSTMGSIGMGLKTYGNLSLKRRGAKERNVGVIGLDGSHSVRFTKILNNPEASPELGGYPVVAAYPKGSLNIGSSVSRIPRYTKEMEKMGVEIVDSVDELLEKVDVVLLITNGWAETFRTSHKGIQGRQTGVYRQTTCRFTNVMY